MEVLTYPNLAYWHFNQRWYWPNAAYTLPLLAFPGVGWAYRKRSAVTVALYVSVLAWWIVLQPFAWRSPELSICVMGVTGALLLVIGENHTTGSRFSIPYRLLGAGITGSALLFLSTIRFVDIWTRHEFHWRNLDVCVFVLLVTASIICGIAVVKQRRSSVALSVIGHLKQMVSRQYIPFGLIGLMCGVLVWNTFGGDPAFAAVLANVAMLFLAYWLISLGLQEDRSRPFAAGVGYFLLWAIVRYIDLFGGFGGMLGAALCFSSAVERSLDWSFIGVTESKNSMFNVATKKTTPCIADGWGWKVSWNGQRVGSGLCWPSGWFFKWWC